jgi:hypothetical protein
MSIEIIGSNDKKIKLITDNNIESIIKNQEIVYNLYKTKYLNLCINNSNQNNQMHLIKQLIKSFYIYNNKKSFNSNLKKFILHLNKFNNNMTLIEYINNFLILNDILLNLELSIKKILFKVFKNKYNKEIIDIKLNNNFYVDILYTLDLIDKNTNKNSNNNINNLIISIKNDLKELDIILDNNKIIKLKNLNNNLIKLNNNTCEIINQIINKLDKIIINNNFIKTNILKIESIINIITEKLYKLYLII